MDDDCGVRQLKPVLRCLDFLADIILDSYRDTNADVHREGKEARKSTRQDADRKSER